MTTGIKKFALLLWKNWILQKRHKIQTLMEILVPLLFSVVLVAIRGIVSSDKIAEPTVFPAFDVADFKGTRVIGGCVLLYAPQNPLTEKVMDSLIMKNAFPTTENYTIEGLKTEAELVDAYINQKYLRRCRIVEHQNENPVLAAVIFNNDVPSGDWTSVENVKYTIRFPSKQHSTDSSDFVKPSWMTDLLYPVFQLLGPRDKPEDNDDPDVVLMKLRGGEPRYWVEGFLYLQQAVDRSLRNLITNQPAEEQIFLNRMPYPTYIDDVFLVALQGFLPLILVFSFIYSVINITKSVAHEKEKRLKESMKMMGLPNWLHWSAWFFKSFLFIIISLAFIVAILKIKFYENLAVLTYSDGTLLYVFLVIYAFSMVTLGFFVSTLFSTANSAATGSGVIFFLTYFPYSFLQPRYNTLSKGTKLITSLLSNTGLSFGCQIIAMYEGTGSGIQWSNVATTVSPDDNLTMLDVMIILLFDGFLYLFLAIYIEGVWPGEYGLPMPWYFPFTKWYWLGTNRGDEVINVASADSRQKKPQYFEKEPNGRAGVQIQGLTKVFDKKTAVNNLYLNMYDNQITALLGHNGAGKTTTMSMLTGLFPPTSGTALVNNFDIRQDIKSVRDNLGLCPQHDVLFDEMTVSEHLRFFALLKGADPSAVDGEIARMLKAINLEMKKDAQAMSLSGGMKRRLSVGIAFVGGSRVVLLDEPSSGLDPGARRQVWDLIQQEKRGRTIILSTHFMDEADLLGDRIAIMAEGQVKCCGSSLFLKKKYGGGYHLIIVKQSHCNVEYITAFLRQKIPDVEVDQNIGSELTYSLAEEYSHLFADMFEELEQRKDELGIASYGASITTMEEVFMRVGKELEEEMRQIENEKNGNGNFVSVPLENGHNNNNKLYQKLDRNEGFELILQQLWAMMVKKGLYAIRNKALLAAQTIIPLAFLIITLIMLKTIPSIESPPARDITLKEYKNYGKTTTLLDCVNDLNICQEYRTYAKFFSEVIDVDKQGQTLENYAIKAASDDISGFNNGYIVGLHRNAVNGTLNGYFNNQPFHAAPLSLNMIGNALLRSNAGVGKNLTIEVKNHPLPLGDIDKIDNLTGAQSSGFNIGFTISFGMSFLSASFVVFLIKERETNAKHLQVVSGVRYPVFWLASFLFDAVNYLLPSIGLLIILVAFQEEDFKSAEMLGYTFILLLMYGYGVLPFMYLFSFAFTIPSSGFTRMVMFNVFTGMATILAISILQVPQLDLVHVANGLEWAFLFLPNFDLGWGISQLSLNSQLHKKCPLLLLSPDVCVLYPENSCCTDFPIGYLAWKSSGIGRNLLFLFLVGTISFLIIFMMESKVLQKITCSKQKQSVTTTDRDPLALEDSDVAAENARIRETNLTQLYKTENLVLRDLTKMYDKFLAVDQLCLGVQKGECFGLLGINGAGKSTTFKMLTGDIPVTSGDAFIHSKSVKTEIKRVQQELGYCPQFDALIPELTGRETIRLFARLRGVKENEIDGLADALAAKLLFSQHIDKACGTYSGGNKRKLSTALALVGNPPMVLLDEPTTGMDPVARRHLWDAISDVREAGTSIVLTSHSMDECEALSTRLAIMVNGKFRCLGSTQHLKNKFGEGYTLIAQIETSREERRMTRQSLELGRRRSSHSKNAQPWEAELTPIRNYIERTFPGSELKDVHAGYVHYHIKDSRVTWGYMFKKMEEAKKEYKIEAYSVGQTTLEQVFLNFTRSQVNEEED